MDANRFDDLVRGAADRVQSRRGVLFGIAAASMTLAFSLDAAEAEALAEAIRRNLIAECPDGRGMRLTLGWVHGGTVYVA